MPAKKQKAQITPLLVDATSASAMLSMSRSFFYEQVASGRIPEPLRYGKKSLWPVAALTEHVRNEVEKQRKGVG